MTTQNSSLEALQDIRRIMERSSRFISLSGLSGLSTGICALIGAYFAHSWIVSPDRANYDGYSLKTRLILLALAVLAVALVPPGILHGEGPTRAACRFGITVLKNYSSI